MALSTELTSDFGTKWTKSGRLATVSGAEELRQSILIGILYEADLSAPPLSQTAIEDQRATIKAAVQDNVKSQEPIRVTADTVDYDTQSVTYKVTTRRVSLPLTVE